MSDKIQFKKGLNFEESKNKRAQQTVTLRKQKRQENLLKRRRQNDHVGFSGEDGLTLTPLYEDDYDLDVCVQDMFDEDINVRYKGIVGIRKILTEDGTLIQEVIDRNLVPYFVRYLNEHHLGIVFECCWILTNITSGDQNQTYAVIASKAVPPLINLVNHEQTEIQEQALWTLGNIVGEFNVFRDFVIDQGVVPAIITALNNTNDKSLLFTGAWCISNLFRGPKQPQWGELRPVIDIMPKMLSYSEDILPDILWAICYYTENTDNIPHIIESRLCETVVELLSSPSFKVQSPALRIVGNIIGGTDTQTDYILSLNVMERIRLMLMTSQEKIKREACWVVSNVAAGTTQHKDILISSNIVPEIIKMIRNEDYEIRREAVWALSNAAAGEDHQKQYLISVNTIEAICEMITNTDIDALRVALEGIIRFLHWENEKKTDIIRLRLESCEALRKVEDIQNECTNSDIYELCDTVLMFTSFRNNAMVNDYTRTNAPNQYSF